MIILLIKYVVKNSERIVFAIVTRGNDSIPLILPNNSEEITILEITVIVSLVSSVVFRLISKEYRCVTCSSHLSTASKF